MFSNRRDFGQITTEVYRIDLNSWPGSWNGKMTVNVAFVPFGGEHGEAEN